MQERDVSKDISAVKGPVIYDIHLFEVQFRADPRSRSGQLRPGVIPLDYGKQRFIPFSLVARYDHNRLLCLSQFPSSVTSRVAGDLTTLMAISNTKLKMPNLGLRTRKKSFRSSKST